VAEARDAAASLASFWSVAVKPSAEQLLGKALGVAHDLDEPGTSAMLLAPFQIEMLDRSHAGLLVRAAVRYGDPWTRELVDVWFGRDRPAYVASQSQRARWLASLPALCDALRDAPEAGVPVGRLLSAAAWTPLRESVDRTLRFPAPSHRHAALSEFGPAVAGLLLSTASLASADLRDEIVAFLRSDNDDMLVCAMSALRAAHPASRDTRAAAGLDIVSRHCAVRLATRLAQPPRTADDWSIELPEGCHCELCQTLDSFLTDQARRSFEWPLAEQRRRHVHARIDQHELPIRHQTRRSGRPYTLVLTKTEALFAREREARQRDRTDLAWLGRTFETR
jgi:hypothetical protein